jgi:ABC-type sulfate transport system permease subunit
VRTFNRWTFISSALLCLAVPTRSLGAGTVVGSVVEGKTRTTASVSIDNLANKLALYNLLSTFSGAHFPQPRIVVAHIGLVF